MQQIKLFFILFFATIYSPWSCQQVDNALLYDDSLVLLNLDDECKNCNTIKDEVFTGKLSYFIVYCLICLFFNLYLKTRKRLDIYWLVVKYIYWPN